MIAFSLKWYFDEINKIPNLTRKEENNLAILARKGDIQARNKLIEANLKSVPTIAKKYHNYFPAIPLWDIINEGNIGLIKATKKFDPDIGVRFISYASWWIRGEIIAAIFIEVSLKINFEKNFYKKTAVVKTTEEGDMDEEDIDNEEIEEIKDLNNISQGIITLGTSHEELEEIRIIDTIEDKNASLLYQKILDESLVDTLNEALDTLTKLERSVIEMRFGLNEYEPMKYKQIGKELHLTAERIRKIKEKAIRRLRHSPMWEKLKDYLSE
jgi:RNA polymerase primary sigma factor